MARKACKDGYFLEIFPKSVEPFFVGQDGDHGWCVACARKVGRIHGRACHIVDMGVVCISSLAVFIAGDSV